MAHTTATRARAYAKVKARKVKWFAENGPCVICGSKESLEMDHIHPETKEHHAIWSWSDERREAELSKCQVLCYDCHLEKTADENKNKLEGIPRHDLRKLTPEKLLIAKEMRENGKTYRAIAEVIGVHHSRINRLFKGTTKYPLLT